MATLRGYKCTKCGYGIIADAKGYEALMFGTKYYFFCSHCKEIVKVPLQEQYPECPICGRMDGLRTWNPVEGRCPQCGHSKLTETGEIIMAD